MRRKHCLKTGYPDRIQIQLQHYKQKYNWDCGVSCVLMVLPNKSRENFLKDFLEICKKEGFNKSTWTIDLCYLLKRFKVDHIFCTVTLGVHPGFSGTTFYSNIISKDESRVRKKFDMAKDNGLSLKKTSVSCSCILDHLINGPIIVLTNANRLTCDTCKWNKLSSELRKCIPWPSAYQGHYIVLCGYDLSSQKIYYRNPAFSNHVCLMPLDTLEEARKSYGTDEDIIFIYS